VIFDEFHERSPLQGDTGLALWCYTCVLCGPIFESCHVGHDDDRQLLASSDAPVVVLRQECSRNAVPSAAGRLRRIGGFDARSSPPPSTTRPSKRRAMRRLPPVRDPSGSRLIDADCAVAP
jgi:hypothetical protein